MTSPAWAQSPQDWLSPPSDLPHVAHGEPTYSLDTLFSALEDRAGRSQRQGDRGSYLGDVDRLGQRHLQSPDEPGEGTRPTTRITISRIKLLDAVIALKPDYVEAWNRRATVYYLKQDYGHALADIAAVLAREPRHFGALSGLGLILQDIGDDKQALEAYRKALAIDPHLENLPDVVKTLSEKVEGRDI